MKKLIVLLYFIFAIFSISTATATTSFPEWKVCIIPDDVCEVVDLTQVVPEGYYAEKWHGLPWAITLLAEEGQPRQKELELYALETFIEGVESARQILKQPRQMYLIDHTTRRVEIRHQNQ